LLDAAAPCLLLQLLLAFLLLLPSCRKVQTPCLLLRLHPHLLLEPCRQLLLLHFHLL
jgi:hypothetical protein